MPGTVLDTEKSSAPLGSPSAAGRQWTAGWLIVVGTEESKPGSMIKSDGGGGQAIWRRGLWLGDTSTETRVG